MPESSEGVLSEAHCVEPKREVAADAPSSVMPHAPPCPPPMAKFAPAPEVESLFGALASGVRTAKSNGLRTAPETTSGSSSISLVATLAEIFAVSV